MRATALAHPMQALIKYHGLKDWRLRIPYHDSISVNIGSLWTKTTVEFGEFERDEVRVNGKELKGKEAERVSNLLRFVKELSGVDLKFRVESINSYPYGEAKGLGFSSSGGAALAVAAYKAAGLDIEFGWDTRLLSRISRRLAGSACRSVVGEYARWYAGKDDLTSYAVKIATRKELDIRMLIVPVNASYSTEEAHLEAASSPFFTTRVKIANKRADELEKAIKDGDFERFGELVERDSIELHAVTMTGSSLLVLAKPTSLKVIETVKNLREEGVKCYYSMQTGPSVFVNVMPEDLSYVKQRIEEEVGIKPIESVIGGEARLV